MPDWMVQPEKHNNKRIRLNRTLFWNLLNRTLFIVRLLNRYLLKSYVAVHSTECRSAVMFGVRDKTKKPETFKLWKRLTCVWQINYSIFRYAWVRRTLVELSTRWLYSDVNFELHGSFWPWWRQDQSAWRTISNSNRKILKYILWA